MLISSLIHTHTRIIFIRHSRQCCQISDARESRTRTTVSSCVTCVQLNGRSSHTHLDACGCVAILLFLLLPSTARIEIVIPCAPHLALNRCKERIGGELTQRYFTSEIFTISIKIKRWKSATAAPVCPFPPGHTSLHSASALECFHEIYEKLVGAVLHQQQPAEWYFLYNIRYCSQYEYRRGSV